MLNRFPIRQIPNGVDTAVYKPLDREQCRAVLGIPRHKRVLISAAAHFGAFWRGGDLLLESLQSLPETLKAETVLLLMGNGGETVARSVGIDTLDMGYVRSDRLKAILYSAADLLIHPTRADMFSLIVLESMACGTPIVSFRVGGIPDLVRPNITGYLAEPGNTCDFRDGIVNLLENDSLRTHLGEQCRAIVQRDYTLELQASRHAELYRQLV